MITGIGSDLVDIRRIEKLYTRFGEVFLRKLFTQAEIDFARTRKNAAIATFAKRFAAKEAFAKALGTGIGSRAHWLEISIVNDASGKPECIITGDTLKTLMQSQPAGKNKHVHVSLSDEYPLAQAFVIISIS